MTYEGIATMNMTMPMTNQALPIFGGCAVTDKKIQLKFPLGGLSFDLPQAPYENCQDMEFKMSGSRGGDLSLRIVYKPDLQAFIGSGIQEGVTVLSFAFYRPENPLKHLKLL